MRATVPLAMLKPLQYAWRVLDRDGRPTAIVIVLDDDADELIVELVRAAAKRQDVTLEPLSV